MEDKQTNPAQIVLIIAGVLLAIVGLGWFLLDTDPATDSAAPRPVAPTSDSPNPLPPVSEVTEDTTEPDSAPAESEPETGAESSPVVAEVVEPEGGEIDADETPPVAASTMEADLRKARMAAEADILISPQTQSALFFYSQVLDADPDHAVARAELEAVLGRLAVRSTDMLDAENYQQAFELAEQVSLVAPDHELVSNVRQTINEVSGERIAQAMEQANAGEDDLALAAVAEAESLPGANLDYLQAVRESIADLLQTQAEAQAATEQRESRARATAEWIARARAALAEGPLVGTSGDDARAIIDEGNADAETVAELNAEWLNAVLASAAERIGEADLEQAEILVAAAEQSSPDADLVTGLRASLEDAYVARESARVIPVTEMVAISTPPARYPRRAEERGLTSWVDVVFTVTRAGDTNNIEITETETGTTLFNSSVLDAVSQWRFEPREYRGQPIEQRVRARLAFTLD